MKVSFAVFPNLAGNPSLTNRQLYMHVNDVYKYTHIIYIRQFFTVASGVFFQLPMSENDLANEIVMPVFH